VIIEHRIAAGSNFTGTNGAATGTLTTVGGGSLAHGETFYLWDGQNKRVGYAFDANGTLQESDVFRAVRFAPGDSATVVRDAIIDAIDRTPSTYLYAAPGGADSIQLTNRLGGARYNYAHPADQVGDAGFVVSPMAGGVNAPFTGERRGVLRQGPATFGGLFDPAFMVPQKGAVSHPHAGWVAQRVVLMLPSITGYTLSILLPDGGEVPVETGTDEHVVLRDIYLGPDERLRLTTTGATEALLARVTAKPTV
jgi:hypothetical protein